MNDPDALGTLIRSSRLDKGLSLGQLATAVGRSPSSVRRWERGESVPSGDVLAELATVLELNIDQLAAMAVSAHSVPTGPEVAQGGEVEDKTEITVSAPKVRTTIEDEDVVFEVVNYFDAAAPVGPPPVPPRPSRYGRASSAVWGRRDSWIGWLRGFLTVLALLFLFMGLVWALGELLTALKDVLGSFSTGG